MQFSRPLSALTVLLLAAISHGPRFQRECSRYLSGWSGFCG
jgi:hypothetical protein